VGFEIITRALALLTTHQILSSNVFSIEGGEGGRVRGARQARILEGVVPQELKCERLVNYRGH